MMLDADQLNFFLNDRARASEIVKAIEKEEKEKEKEQLKANEPKKKPKKEQLPKPGPQPEIQPARVEKAETATPPDPAEKKSTPKTQSTLFDGF
jgi:replication factor C large subunit